MTAAGEQFGATAGRASYEAELVRIREKLSKLESQSQRLDSLTLQQQVDEENFRNYLQAVNDASVSDDLNRQRISSIAIVQSPTVAVAPTRPRTKIVVPPAEASIWPLAEKASVPAPSGLDHTRLGAPWPQAAPALARRRRRRRLPIPAIGRA